MCCTIDVYEFLCHKKPNIPTILTRLPLKNIFFLKVAKIKLIDLSRKLWKCSNSKIYCIRQELQCSFIMARSQYWPRISGFLWTPKKCSLKRECPLKSRQPEYLNISHIIYMFNDLIEILVFTSRNIFHRILGWNFQIHSF